MQATECDNAFDNPMLSAHNISDPDSYKVCNGDVGGYLKYFDKEQIFYLDRAVELLDDFYQYSASNGSGQRAMGNLPGGQ